MHRYSIFLSIARRRRPLLLGAVPSLTRVQVRARATLCAFGLIRCRVWFLKPLRLLVSRDRAANDRFEQDKKVTLSRAIISGTDA